MWYNLDDIGVKIYITDNFEFLPNIVFCSLNNTLIKNLYNNADIIFYNYRVLPFLQEIKHKGSIIIVENAVKDSFDLKFENFVKCKMLDIPLLCLFIKKTSTFKKPYTHIMKIINRIYHTHYTKLNLSPVELSLDKSIYIGNEAGRYSYGSFGSDKYDYDRAFSNNINIVFRTPEEIFLNITISRRWAWKSLNYKNNDADVPELSKILDINGKAVILIKGPKSSGKSQLGGQVYDYLRKRFIVVFKDINNDNRGDILDELSNFHLLEYPILIIVDDFTPDIYKCYIEKIQTNKICINIDTNLNTCLFLNRIKIQKNYTSKEYTEKEISDWFYYKFDIPEVSYPLILKLQDNETNYYL